MDALAFLLVVGLALYASGAASSAEPDSGDGGDEGDAQMSGTVLDASTVFQLAQDAINEAGVADIDPAMLTAIAYVESRFDPGAVRQEPSLNDASVGLVQTLVSTATWLYGQGFNSYSPAADSLSAANVSLYFGAAYLGYLRHYGGMMQPDEWVVRAYNGGPGWATKSSAVQQRTANYLAAYSTALGNLALA